MNFYLLNSKGPGTDEKALIRILCAKESKEIETLKAAYKRRNIKINFKIIWFTLSLNVLIIKVYDVDLEKDLSHEEGGYLGEIIFNILQLFS